MMVGHTGMMGQEGVVSGVAVRSRVEAALMIGVRSSYIFLPGHH